MERERENHLNLQFSTYWCFLLMSLYICTSKRQTPPWFLVGPWARGPQLCGWKNQGKKPDILSHFTRGVVNLTHFIFVFHYYQGRQSIPKSGSSEWGEARNFRVYDTIAPKNLHMHWLTWLVWCPWLCQSLPNRTDRVYPSTVVYGENQKSLSN